MMNFGRFIEGGFEDKGGELKVLDPDDDSVAGTVRTCGANDVNNAIAYAEKTFRTFSKIPMCDRLAMLEKAAVLIESRLEEFADCIRREAGKPIMLCRLEVKRAADTIRMTIHSASELNGEYRNMDCHAQGKGFLGIVGRFPVGPIAAITPFNFPLNLAIHKIAPALAAGCSVIHKPARKTPLSAHMLAKTFEEAGLPSGAYQITVAEPQSAELLARDNRIKLLTFTGSALVGHHLKSLSIDKKIVLELGGNAAVIVEDDADLKNAARQIAIGAFTYAGQVCISVQRILVSKKIYEPFRKLLIQATAENAIVGRTADPKVIVGPMISSTEADRVNSWVDEAVKSGAVSLTGRSWDKNIIHPVLLENVDEKAKVMREEAFGPVACVIPYDSLDEAIKVVNDSKYGLQAGIFTSSINKAFYAFQNLEVGGVIVNDVPTRRLDHMPYGGVKGSGEGREGPAYALRHMTEERVMLIKQGNP